MTYSRDDAAEIKRELTDGLERVLDKFCPGWVLVKGHAYPAYVKKGDLGSWQVYLRDCKEGKRGEWFRRSAGVGGDVINLIAYALTNNHKNYGPAFEAAKEFLGWKDVTEEESEERRKQREKAQRDRELASEQRQAEIAQKREQDAAEADELWKLHVPVAGTGAEVYLRDRRRIRKPAAGWPDTIGFMPKLYHRMLKRSFPATVARVQGMNGATIALHAVFLDPKTFAKIDDPEWAKITYGPMGGGAVRFGGVATAIEMCEGFETGLGILHLIEFTAPVWCCLSTSGVKGIELPLEVERVRLWPDGDLAIRRQPDGTLAPIERGPGEEAGFALSQRLVPIGIGFTMNPVPGAGLKKSDYLDVYHAVMANDE